MEIDVILDNSNGNPCMFNTEEEDIDEALTPSTEI